MDGELPASVLRAWPGLVVEKAPYGTGLINQTRMARLGGERVIFQEVSAGFVGVDADIEPVTAHLARKGLVTPRLVRTVDRKLAAHDDSGRSFRLLTFVDGESFDRLPDLRATREAGALVARFHVGVSDLQHRYVHTRPGIHDVGYRAMALRDALAKHGDHRLHAEVERASEPVLRAADRLLLCGTTAQRHAHGDLKASNLLFDKDGRGLCLVDLDTLALMMWPFEMGDALRSWCNPSGEDATAARIDLARFSAAVEGYAEAAAGLELAAAEVELLPRGIETIAAELAMRFLTDALEERYFGFDATHYSTRGEHNLVRARGQWALAESVRQNLGELERIARAALVKP